MNEKPPLNAVLQLRRGWGAAVGSDRVALLKAIDRQGSISAAGQEVDLSFRAAWTAVQAINALFEDPSVLARAGGRGGGGATLSPSGRALIRRYDRLEREVQALVAEFEAAVEADPGSRRQASAEPDLAALSERSQRPALTSARNVLAGVVRALRSDAVSCEIIIALDERLALRARITRSSAEALGLRLGSPVQALIKSNFVQLQPAAGGVAQTTFDLLGVVSHRTAGRRSEEFHVILDGGAALTATLERRKVGGLAVGDRVRVEVDPANILLAVA